MSGHASVQDSSQGIVFGGGFQQGPASANTARNPVPRHTVTGTVVNSLTGEPIRRALVHINGPEPSFGFTGADGRYDIPNVPEGQVFLNAQKPGFFDESTGPTSHSPYSGIRLGPATGDIVLKLVPEAKIRGRVLDKTGEPIENVNVQLMARVINQGQAQWQAHGQGTTDEAGVYSIENLMPGRYAIHTLPLAATPESPAADDSTSSEVFPGKYYPDAPDLSSVQPFDLKPGQELPVDFTLAPVRSFRVSGIISGGGQNRLGVLCLDAEGQRVSQGTRLDFRTGRFTIGAVPPGSWIIRGFSQGGQEHSLQAEQPIQISSSDIKGLVLQLQPLPSISVHVLNQPDFRGGLPLQLVSTSDRQDGRLQAFEMPGQTPDGLAFHNVPPDTYRLVAQFLGYGKTCLGSALSGATDLGRDDLTVTAGSPPPPIEVTMREDCATVSGSVTSSSSPQSVTGFVILVSGSGLRAAMSIPLQPDGKFSFAMLTPGDYRLFAFTDIADLEYANPEALRDFTGKQVTVGPNEKTNLQLDLVARGK